MTRRSERGKTKTTTQEETPDKTARKPVRQTRRRRKSSSSSEDPSQNLNKEVPNNAAETVGVELDDIQLPQGSEPPTAADTNKNELPANSDVADKDWKEDNSFWGNNEAKVEQLPATADNAEEKEENSLWNVQSSNGASSGGEIPKLKICRQRPTESPESGDTTSRKRSNPSRDGRTTDDSTHEESEKETRKSKYRTRTSSRNSPMLSPTVVCDMSEGSPTKIKIINVSHKSKGGQKAGEEDSNVDNVPKINPIEDIALPLDDLSQKSPNEVNEEVLEVKVNDSPMDTIGSDMPASNIDESLKDDIKHIELPEDSVSTKISPKKSTSESSSPKKLEEGEKSPSKSSRSDSDSSGDESKPRRVKKKRRRELQSTIQRKEKSSDSEDEEEKMEATRRDSSESTHVKNVPNGEENKEVINEQTQDNVDVKVQNDEEKSMPMARKRRWGSSKSNRSSIKQPVLNISTDVLKSIIPDAKPVSAEELQLSVEEEEGQLDDDEDEDDVVALVAKEEEKELERERLQEEKEKEKEKELKDKKKRQERFQKTMPEQTPTVPLKDKGAAQRKILLLTDDAKKLARSPSPPRRKPTSVLYITHLVRPFTVQQLKNLLLRTGTITENGFWIDKIKSKCYVEYTTEDAAVETRHALHGVRWPTSNPKTLFVEFASHDDLVMAQTLSEEPEVPRKAEPLNMVEGWVVEQARIKDKTRRPIVREWDVGKPEHPDEALEFEMKAKEKRDQERKSRKERHHRSHTPEGEPPARKPRRKEEDAPAKLLDDLFRKTKSSPCIYWLPLSQEQMTESEEKPKSDAQNPPRKKIAVKEEMRRQHMAEHQRRMAELKKAEQARRDRERRNRK